MNRGYGFLSFLAVVSLLLSACSDGEVEPEVINVDQRGFIRVQAGVQATLILTSVGVVGDAASAYQRIRPFFDDLVAQVSPQDSDLAEEIKNTVALLNQSFQDFESGQATADLFPQLAADGASLLDEVGRAASLLGYALPTVTPPPMPTPTAAPSPSPSPTVTPTPTPTATP